MTLKNMIAATFVAAAAFAMPVSAFGDDKDNRAAGNADRTNRDDQSTKVNDRTAADSERSARQQSDQAVNRAEAEARNAANTPADSAQPAGARASGRTAARRGDSVSRIGRGQIQNADQKFVRAAASGGMLEVRLGELAQQKAQSEEVKEFARMMVEDHTQGNKQLMQVAQAANIPVPSEMKPSHRAVYEELSQLEGAEFERAYVYGQVADHQKMILKHRDAAAELQNPQLKQLAAQMLPKLQRHYQHAAQLAGWDELSATTAGSTEHGTHTTGTGSRQDTANDSDANRRKND